MPPKKSDRPAGGIPREAYRALWAMGVHLGVFVALAIVLGGVVPTFHKMSKEFEIKLPAVTEVVINLGNVFRRYSFLFACAFLLIDVPLCVAVQFLPQRHRRIRTAWHYGFLFFGLALIVFCILALIMPLSSLVEKLSK